MKKYIIIFVVLSATIIGVIWGVYYYNYGEWYVLNRSGVSHNYDDGGVSYIIDDEETALAVGTAILKDFEPEWYESVKNDFVAKKENGVWTIYNEIKISKNRLRKYSVKGGGALYVQFKENGEIIRVGVDD